MATATIPNRRDLFAWASASNTPRCLELPREALVSIFAGILAGSVSLIGFGLDSLI